ncbi:flavin reductase family protein [Bartonella sp. HY329]|uniref:flavin reductase family protein n=1 Tax=unclassified Bartonella TaxID=2645622 RepID=UPI0021C7F4F0|nr:MULTISPECIES: flavin reductase family protein [unclassified Bartonella]UXM94022.1 flavin reductase family protein [Bartonella sp. HY329]UXN08344.1 flavin reductase family protein [Bartonella sp. HY328]
MTDPINTIELEKMEPIASQSYRDAMSHFAAAVHIVTTDGLAGKRATTISACCSLSDSPPTLLVCLMKTHSNNRFFIDNGRFCINTLASNSQNLSDIFGGRTTIPPEERFEKAKWQTLKTGAPALIGALASFDCRLVGWHEHDTHYVLYGAVVDIQIADADDALIYLNRAYHYLPLKSDKNV